MSETQMLGFIKDDIDGAPGKIGVAIVRKDTALEYGELVDFRLCDDAAERDAYLASYGIDPTPVWSRPELARSGQ